MTDGPIEFLHEVKHDVLPDTEYGGRGGLIQPATVGVGEPAHDLTPSETADVVHRYGKRPLGAVAGYTGMLDEPVQDPETGRIVDTGDLEDATGTGGSLTDLLP